MDIYQDKQIFDRTPGAVGAASDGMAPGQAYPAVVRTNTNSKGYCTVTIPALHLSYTFQAKTVSTVGVGTNVLVLFDQEKIPWVVTPTAGTPAVAMAYRSAAQTGIKSSVETRVQLDTVIKDPGNNFNVTAGNGFYTVPAEGYYHIDGAVNLTTAEATYALIPYIRINGSPIPLRGAEAARHPGGGTSEITQVTGIVFLKAGDKVELMIYQTSGTDKEIPTANEGYTRMSIMRVGEGGPQGKEGPEGGTAVTNSVATGSRAGEQKIPSAAFTRVKLNNTISDPHSNFDLTNGYYVVPAEGYYHIDGTVAFETVKKGAVVIASVSVNGSAELIRGVRRDTIDENEGVGSVVSGSLFCKAGDHIELLAYQSGGDERKLEPGGASQLNQLSVARIGTGATGPPGPVSAEFVSALPANPTDGKEIYYQNAALAEKGVVWHLRYRAASASGYKWEFVGGGEYAIFASGGANTLAKADFTAQEAVGSPALTLPLSGDYTVSGYAWEASKKAGAEEGQTVQLNAGVGPKSTNLGGIGVALYQPGTYGISFFAGRFTFGSLVAGDVLKVYISGQNTAANLWNVNNMEILVVPIRVG